MTINLRLLLTAGVFLCLNCSKDEKNPVIGIWVLDTWTVDLPLESEFGVEVSQNFLDHTTCAVNETLQFDKDGIVTSTDTFSPEVTISSKNDASEIYVVTDICSEGAIGFSTTFEQDSDNHIVFNSAQGFLQDKKLTFIYLNAIEVYNEPLTEVIGIRDLKLIYKKKQ